ncbi:MAG TPA: hypothetical protein VI636_19015 [Candidatus Angelobacter sp.]
MPDSPGLAAGATGPRDMLPSVSVTAELTTVAALENFGKLLVEPPEVVTVV